MANDTTKSFFHWLDVIKAIAGDRSLPATDIAKLLGTSTRNAYYVLKALDEYGFVVNRDHGWYNLDVESPFFQNIREQVNFNVDQVNYLYRLLLRENTESPMVGGVLSKFQHYFHTYLGPVDEKSFEPYKNYRLLKKAIKQHKCVILHKYASSNSLTVKDRCVEPFMFLGDETDVRAYEPSSDMNKTYKISRIGTVEVLDQSWMYADEHKYAFTDMFLYSGEVRHRVRLRFDVSAYNFMQEEYPHARKCLTKGDDDTHWLFETDIANYEGIGRFVLGLYEHIEVIEDDGLKAYLKEKIRRMRT
jgi:hypothetical protein